MSTRSTIGAMIDNKIHSVYCHFDGYPDAKMPTLTKHYNTQEKVEQLISGGGMSSLEDDVEKITYYKDRGEDINISIFDNIKEWFNDGGEEYNYLFLNNVWYCLEDVGNDEEDSEENGKEAIFLAVKLLKEKEKLEKVLSEKE